MIEAIRGVTIYKGIDPREYTLLSLRVRGRSAHQRDRGRARDRQILVPALPGAFSAFGLICSDLKFDLTRPVVRPLDASRRRTDASCSRSSSGKASGCWRAQEIPPAHASIQRCIEGHYVGQTWETVAKAPAGALDATAARGSKRSSTRPTSGYGRSVRTISRSSSSTSASPSLAPVEKPRLPRAVQAERWEAPTDARACSNGQVHLPRRCAAGESRSTPGRACSPEDIIEGPAAIVETDDDDASCSTVTSAGSTSTGTCGSRRGGTRRWRGRTGGRRSRSAT